MVRMNVRSCLAGEMLVWYQCRPVGLKEPLRYLAPACLVVPGGQYVYCRVASHGSQYQCVYSSTFTYRHGVVYEVPAFSTCTGYTWWEILQDPHGSQVILRTSNSSHYSTKRASWQACHPYNRQPTATLASRHAGLLAERRARCLITKYGH